MLAEFETKRASFLGSTSRLNATVIIASSLNCCQEESSSHLLPHTIDMSPKPASLLPRRHRWPYCERGLCCLLYGPTRCNQQNCHSTAVLQQAFLLHNRHLITKHSMTRDGAEKDRPGLSANVAPKKDKFLKKKLFHRSTKVEATEKTRQDKTRQDKTQKWRGTV